MDIAKEIFEKIKSEVDKEDLNKSWFLTELKTKDFSGRPTTFYFFFTLNLGIDPFILRGGIEKPPVPIYQMFQNGKIYNYLLDAELVNMFRTEEAMKVLVKRFPHASLTSTKLGHAEEITNKMQIGKDKKPYDTLFKMFKDSVEQLGKSCINKLFIDGYRKICPEPIRDN